MRVGINVRMAELAHKLDGYVRAAPNNSDSPVIDQAQGVLMLATQGHNTCFRAECVAAFLAMIWAAYQLRVRQSAFQFNMRLEERVAVRTRIARDLHDTLPQSFQALLPLFQAAIYKLPEGAVDARKTLEVAVDRASNAITQGRQRSA